MGETIDFSMNGCGTMDSHRQMKEAGHIPHICICMYVYICNLKMDQQPKYKN